MSGRWRAMHCQCAPSSALAHSSPLVVQNGNGTWLVIAHEHKRARTVALNRDSGELCWTSEANQPGTYFFGYSYYDRKDGTKLILQRRAADMEDRLRAASGAFHELLMDRFDDWALI